MREYTVTKEILNIRSKPTDESDDTYVGYLLQGDTVWLDETEIIGTIPKGGTTDVWLTHNDNNVVAKDGVRLRDYEDKVTEFVRDQSMANIHNNSFKEEDWKVSWAHVDLEIWKIWNSNANGKNVRVAVLDSGINLSIEDITDAIEDKNLDLKCFIPNETIDDDLGHGTTCASIIASRGFKSLGVAPNCSLIIGKIESKNFGKNPIIILSALKWAFEERNADIVSLSFSFPLKSNIPLGTDDQNIADYINKMNKEKNKFFVGSIGNLGEKAKDFNSYPANYDGCISIGGYARNRIVWNGSSWNANLSFIVPCSDLKGYVDTINVDVLKPETSFACPFAVGIIANLLSYYRNKNLSFNSDDIVKQLKYDTLPDNNPLKTGKGIINPLLSLQNL